MAPRIPGMPSIIPDLSKVRLGIDNNRLSALVAALLDAAGGSVTLTKAQMERVWNNPQIHYNKTVDGGITLSLSAMPQPSEYETCTELPGCTSEVHLVSCPESGIRQPEV